jgi:hypothetical protein
MRTRLHQRGEDTANLSHRGCVRPAAQSRRDGRSRCRAEDNRAEDNRAEDNRAEDNVVHGNEDWCGRAVRGGS